MTRTFLFAGLCSFFLSLIFGYFFIKILNKKKIGQPILKYVENHKGKSGTPTGGGLFFIVSCSVVFLFFKGNDSRIAKVALCYGLSFMAVGLIDDFLKIKLHHNEGLKAYQKILFQLSISIVAGLFVYRNNLVYQFIPFVKKSVNLGFWAIPITAIIFIATTNSVNLTDGLDGLAGLSSVFYLIFIAILIVIEENNFKSIYLNVDEYDNLVLLSVCLIGAILGFLVFNINKASVFMGDTGSLALGSFISAISLFSLNGFFIPVIGLVFVFSSMSVIIQVAYFKLKKKRVFLMAPLHHHFQLKGYSETKIAYVYSIITIILGVVSIIFYI